MLRRNSSDRLQRRKSTLAVHSQHEPIDPLLARQHAQAAATYAFTRAQERESADLGRGRLSRSRSGFSQQDQHPMSEPDGGLYNEDMRRQNSVRFAGPTAIPRRQSIGTRATQNPVRSKGSLAAPRPTAITTTAPVPAAYRPPSRSSSIGKASVGKGTAESFATALAAYDEYYSREDDVVSTPSSYRRIRKSKSMFSPLKAPNVFYTNGTPERPFSPCNGYRTSFRNPPSEPSQVPLRAPNSMSFLRGGRDPMATSRERNDTAVQMARDKFFHQAAQQRLREQPSFLFRSKAQRQDKSFRKTVRSSSSNSYGMPIASVNQIQASKESGLKDKARRASQNLKSKLRWVFGLGKDEPVVIPNQQVDARETHVREYLGDSDIMHESFINVPHPNEAAISRVASRVPSLHAVASNQQLRSHAGSVKSMRSSHSDDKSRVTSWNSTGVNTITSLAARAQAEREQQRLSIINENGTHVSSSSFGRPSLGNQFSSYPKFPRPGKSPGQGLAPVPGVDSARVYSALMKRLDENSPKTKLEASRKGSFEIFTPLRVPPRSSSVNSSRGNRSPATIRQVTDERDLSRGRSETTNHDHHWVRADSIHAGEAEEVFGRTGSHVHRWVAADSLREERMRNGDDIFSPKESESNNGNHNAGQIRGRANSSSSASRQLSTKTSYHTVSENLGVTPQQLAFHNEPVVQGTKGLREARSTFFGGSSFTIARTTSPYRRALAENEYNSTLADRYPPGCAHNSTILNPLLLSAENATIGTQGYDFINSQKAYSESVYSRTPSGQTTGAAQSTSSLSAGDELVGEMQFPHSANGDVVIIDRATYRPAMPRSRGHRVASSASSSEWKMWMSSEVAKLERAKENNYDSYVNYALPTMPNSFHGGHVRENAQMNDDDIDIVPRKFNVVTQPLGNVEQNCSSIKPILKNRSAVSLVDNIRPNIGHENVIPIPLPPPPIPVRSPLRPTQSKSSLRSLATNATQATLSAPSSVLKTSSLNGRNMLQKRNGSSTTLRSLTGVETSAKLVKRNGRAVTYNTSSSSPGITAAVEKQFGSASQGSRISKLGGSRENKENDSPERDELYGSDGAGLMGPTKLRKLDAQAMGSKRMVDLFLSSRRRRIAGGSEESGGGMFL